jgi:hypothetical protein
LTIPLLFRVSLPIYNLSDSTSARIIDSDYTITYTLPYIDLNVLLPFLSESIHGLYGVNRVYGLEKSFNESFNMDFRWFGWLD